MTSPTIPPHAVSIWLEDGSIHMDLPAIGSHLNHRLTFPNNAHGQARMMHLLSQRTHESRIGEAGDLTQHQVNKALIRKRLEAAEADYVLTQGKIGTKPKTIFTPAMRQGARDVLRRLGLT